MRRRGRREGWRWRPRERRREWSCWVREAEEGEDERREERGGMRRGEGGERWRRREKEVKA